CARFSKATGRFDSW
nr:immunoglobulin heavy chain junction region [Macaca mulatta]MOW26432.1 immunoglobulin heavy chain junction region [Macaca mulatta]